MSFVYCRTGRTELLKVLDGQPHVFQISKLFEDAEHSNLVFLWECIEESVREQCQLYTASYGLSELRTVANNINTPIYSDSQRSQ